MGEKSFSKFGTTSFSRKHYDYDGKKKIGMLTDDATFVGVFGNNTFLCFSSTYVHRRQEIYYLLTLIHLLLVIYKDWANLLTESDANGF